MACWSRRGGDAFFMKALTNEKSTFPNVYGVLVGLLHVTRAEGPHTLGIIAGRYLTPATRCSTPPVVPHKVEANRQCQGALSGRLR